MKALFVLLVLSVVAIVVAVIAIRWRLRRHLHPATRKNPACVGDPGHLTQSDEALKETLRELEAERESVET